MRRASFSLFICLLAGGLAAGCASTAKIAAPSPVGEWDYTVVNTPQGDVIGVMMVDAEGGVYSGEIGSEMLNQVVAMRDIAFQDSVFTFKATFDIGGDLIDTATRMTLNGTMMKGMMDVTDIGKYEINATRKEAPGSEM